MFLTIIILVVITVLSVLFIQVNVTNPQILPDIQQTEYINNSVSNIEYQTNILLDEINSINSEINNIRNDNIFMTREIATIVNDINSFGFGLSPAIPEIPPEEVFESPYPELVDYIENQIASVSNYPCGLILSSVFNKLLNEPNYTYNNELSYYLGDPPLLISDLMSAIGNNEPYSVIQAKILNIINTCKHVDDNNKLTQFFEFATNQVNALNPLHACKHYLNILFTNMRNYPNFVYNNELVDYEPINLGILPVESRSISDMVSDIVTLLDNLNISSAESNTILLIRRLRDIDRFVSPYLIKFLGQPYVYP